MAISLSSWRIIAIAALLPVITGCEMTYDQQSGRTSNFSLFGNGGYMYSNYRSHFPYRYRYDHNYRMQSMRSERPSGPPRVPNSYHFQGRNVPVSHKQRDEDWVKQQNPQGYTIELDSSDNRADVARSLHRAPKNARRAQYPYEQNGEKRYRAVYGTYPSREAAQQALSDLPDEVRSNAGVKQWQSVRPTSPAQTQQTRPDIIDQMPAVDGE